MEMKSVRASSRQRNPKGVGWLQSQQHAKFCDLNGQLLVPSIDFLLVLDENVTKG